MVVDVAVVVVTYNSLRVIEGLLDSLPEALGSASFSVRVVDNGSTDGTPEAIERLDPPFTDLDVVRSRNNGYSAGINRGVAASPHSGAVLILNPDVRLDPGFLVPMRAALSRGGAGIVAPRLRDAEGRRSNSLRRAPSLGRALGLGFTGIPALSEDVIDDDAYVSAHSVDWATGAVLIVARDCHDALGGWDESFFLYSEETDFCLRAADAGWSTVYEPAASAVHIGGDSGRNDKTHTMQIVNRVRFYVRRKGRTRGWVYYSLTLASEFSWVLRGHPQSRAAIIALLWPRCRPPELGCSHSLLPC